jgi:uncharacterized membrane protein
MSRLTIAPRRPRADPRSALGRLALPILIGATIGAALGVAGLRPTTLSTALAAACLGSVGATGLRLRRGDRDTPLSYVINWSLLLGASFAAVFVLSSST